MHTRLDCQVSGSGYALLSRLEMGSDQERCEQDPNRPLCHTQVVPQIDRFVRLQMRYEVESSE
jgi:hypothetical protein